MKIVYLSILNFHLSLCICLFVDKKKKKKKEEEEEEEFTLIICASFVFSY